MSTSVLATPQTNALWSVAHASVARACIDAHSVCVYIGVLVSGATIGLAIVDSAQLV